MAILVRPPEELDARVRASASRQGLPLNKWWIQAAESSLQREEIDLVQISAEINADPIDREILDRLAQ